MRLKKGTVVSSKMDKTAVVVSHQYKNHPKYKKRYRISKKFYVDDPENTLKEGDIVKIGETKPISKLKRWNIVKIYKTGSDIPKVDEIAPSVDEIISKEKEEKEKIREKEDKKKEEAKKKTEESEKDKKEIKEEKK